MSKKERRRTGKIIVDSNGDNDEEQKMATMNRDVTTWQTYVDMFNTRGTRFKP